jgi:hypothetical protein
MVWCVAIEASVEESMLGNATLQFDRDHVVKMRFIADLGGVILAKTSTSSDMAF